VVSESHAAIVGLLTMAKYFNGEVRLEMDNQSITAELSAQYPSRSPCYGLIMDIKNAMTAFSACSVRCVKRQNNSLAHSLAALTRSTGDKVMIADVPQSLRNLMLSECSAPSE
jgi:hypothetical protein